MRRNRTAPARRCLVVILCSVMRAGRRVRRLCEPEVRAMLQRLGGSGEGAEVLAVHVIIAAAGGGGLAVASRLVGGGVGALLEAASVLAVGAVAVSAAFVLVQRRVGARRELRIDALLAATALSVSEQSYAVPAARTLRLVCQARQLSWRNVDVAAVLRHVADKALKRLVLGPVKTLVPGLALASDAMGVARASVESARFVREFALTAVVLAAPVLLGEGVDVAAVALIDTGDEQAIEAEGVEVQGVEAEGVEAEGVEAPPCAVERLPLAAALDESRAAA